MKRSPVFTYLVPVLLSTGGISFAQGTAPGSRPTSNLQPTATQTENARTRTVKDILRRLEEGAGGNVRIVADSTILNERVPLPQDSTTPQNFEVQIEALVKALPQGTTWAKLYLPTSDTARNYRGDDVAEFALAQSKLFGKIGAAPTGTVEVMGQIMPTDKAQPIVEALHLKPVYLITNPLAKAVSAGNAAWSQMTDEQRKNFARNEAQKFLDQGPDAFVQSFGNYFGQQSAVMGALFTMMSPEQRTQYSQAMMQQIKNSGGPSISFQKQAGNPSQP